MAKRFFWLCACVVGCGQSLNVPTGAQIECTDSNDCPEGFACNGGLGVCFALDLNQPPELTLNVPNERQLTDVVVEYTLIDPNPDDRVTLSVEWRSECPSCAADYQPATTRDTTDLAGSGSGNFVWESATDLPAGAAVDQGEQPIAVSSFQSSVFLRVRATDSGGAQNSEPVVVGPFAVGNDAPTLSVAGFAAVQSGDVSIRVSLADTAGDFAGVEVEFNRGDQDPEGLLFVADTNVLPFPSLFTSTDGTPHEVIWRSRTPDTVDGPRGIGNVTARDLALFVRAYDEPQPGVRHYTPFQVLTLDVLRNQNPVEVSELFVGRIDLVDGDGPMPITFTLEDAEFDPADVAVEFSIDGGATYLPCREYPAPWSEAMTGLLTRPFEDGGIEHTFVWDPSGETLIRPATTRVRVTPFDASSGVEGSSAERLLPNSIGPDASAGSVLTATRDIEALNSGELQVIAGDFDNDGSTDLALGSGLLIRDRTTAEALLSPLENGIRLATLSIAGSRDRILMATETELVLYEFDTAALVELDRIAINAYDNPDRLDTPTGFGVISILPPSVPLEESAVVYVFLEAIYDSPPVETIVQRITIDGDNFDAIATQFITDDGAGGEYQASIRADFDRDDNDEVLVNRAIADLEIFEDEGGTLVRSFSEPRLEGRIFVEAEAGGRPGSELLASDGLGRLDVLTFDSNGIPEASSRLITRDIAINAVTTDLNGDSFEDIVVAHCRPEGIGVFLGREPGDDSLPSYSAMQFVSLSTLIRDTGVTPAPLPCFLFGDNRLSPTPTQLFVLEGQDTGPVVAWVLPDYTFLLGVQTAGARLGGRLELAERPLGPTASEIVIADAESDGYPDLFVQDSWLPTRNLALGLSGATLQRSCLEVEASDIVTPIGFFDVDNDGRSAPLLRVRDFLNNELATVSCEGASAGPPDGIFLNAEFYANEFSFGRPLDFDGDGFLDSIIVQGGRAPSAPVELIAYRGLADLTVEEADTTSIPVPAGEMDAFSVLTTLVDVDRDGADELIVLLRARDGSGACTEDRFYTLTLELGAGPEVFPVVTPPWELFEPTTLSGGLFSSFITLAGYLDINTDGIPDRLIGASGADPSAFCETSIALEVGYGDGTGAFSAPLELTTTVPFSTSNPGASAVVDLNGDGWGDLAVNDSVGTQTHLFLSTPGPGDTRTQAFDRVLTRDPDDRFFRAMDLNRDDLVDLVGATFSLWPGRQPATLSPRSVAFARWDGSTVGPEPLSLVGAATARSVVAGVPVGTDDVLDISRLLLALEQDGISIAPPVTPLAVATRFRDDWQFERVQVQGQLRTRLARRFGQPGNNGSLEPFDVSPEQTSEKSGYVVSLSLLEGRTNEGDLTTRFDVVVAQRVLDFERDPDDASLLPLIGGRDVVIETEQWRAVPGVSTSTNDATADFFGSGPRFRVNWDARRVEILTDRLGVFVALLVPK